MRAETPETFVSSSWGDGPNGYAKRLSAAEARMQDRRMRTAANVTKLATWRRKWREFQDRMYEERLSVIAPVPCCGRCHAHEEFMAGADPRENNTKALVRYLAGHHCLSVSNCLSWITKRSMTEDEMESALNGTPAYQARERERERKQKEQKIERRARRNARQQSVADNEAYSGADHSDEAVQTPSRKRHDDGAEAGPRLDLL